MRDHQKSIMHNVGPLINEHWGCRWVTNACTALALVALGHSSFSFKPFVFVATVAGFAVSFIFPYGLQCALKSEFRFLHCGCKSYLQALGYYLELMLAKNTSTFKMRTETLLHNVFFFFCNSSWQLLRNIWEIFWDASENEETTQFKTENALG